MARLLIAKYKNNNDKSTAYGKTYGRLVHQDTMNTSDLCRHMMKHGTIFTSDVVKGVVERFIMCFEELLLEGNKIKLDGLGTFYLSASTEGVADESKFSANNVKAIHVRFLPDQSKESEYTAKMLTKKARFRSVNGEEMPEAGEGEGSGE
ncbi:MAG: HU family DNA-binding protein [Prevotella sp.]|nr:HU family DNA-binding protein [Prevotella sp.]